MDSIAPVDGPYINLDGKKLLDFSSCDYLGLAQHPEVKKGAIKYALKYGVGALLNSFPQKEVEKKLAQYLNKETALLLTSDIDVTALKKTKIKEITDTLGMVGDNGFGSASEGDVVYGALHFGGANFIAGPKKQLASFTAEKISFPALGAIDCALSFIPEMEQERKMVLKHKSWLVKQLSDFSLKEEKMPKAILTSPEADAIRQFLMQEQIYLAPSSSNSLYFAITALHTPDDLDQLSVALKKLSETDLALATQLLTPTPSR